MSALTGIEAERRIHSRLLDLQCDHQVLELLLPGGKPHDYETSLWDYKRLFPDTSGRGDDQAQRSLEELIKDIAAFHNTFGGYILCGIDHLSQAPIVGCQATTDYRFTVEKLNDQLKKYLGKSVGCRFSRLDVQTEKNQQVQVGLLAIPMRSVHEPVVRMASGDREELLDLVIRGLEEFPCFIVVDDVDRATPRDDCAHPEAGEQIARFAREASWD